MGQLLFQIHICLFVIAGLFQQVQAAINFQQCFQDLNSSLANKNNITLNDKLGFGSQLNLSVPNTSFGTLGLTDSDGNLVSDASQAAGIGYKLCMAYCGTGEEPFTWSDFSQKFNAWLLPWLALISQLPFGAMNNLDNLTSVTLAIGSPTLAAYSLALTVLNGRWVARRFSGISFPNSQHAHRIMSSLQQMPLVLNNQDSLLTSLIVLQENDDWWARLAEGLDYTNSWSIAAVAQTIWIVIAYIFTVADSPPDFSVDFNGNVDGQATGFLWLWMLPVVIGWLKISPKSDWRRVKRAVDHANAIAYVAMPDSDEPVHVKVISDERALTIEMESEHTSHDDRRCSAPIFNYARFLPWTQMVEDVSDAFRSAANNFRNRRPVHPSSPWRSGGYSAQISNRSGFRAHVDAYCSIPSYVKRSNWDSDIVSRFLLASTLALVVQWSSAGSAIIITWFYPTVGLGCNSGSYIIYAATSTLVWILLVISSILSHYSSFHYQYPISTPFNDQSSIDNRTFVDILYLSSNPNSTHSQKIINTLAVAFRRIGKLLAIFNTIWIIAVCGFQFSGIFSRCYCTSNVMGLKGRAFTTIVPTSDAIALMKEVWIGGVILALGCASGFVGFVTLFTHPKF